MAIVTTATKKLLNLRKKIRAVSGGTGASKTYSIVMILIDYCQSNNNEKVDVVSESFPHLEDGAIADFRGIMTDRGYWRDERWNDTKHTYTFETGTRLKFISFDKIGKAHGPRRDVLFGNEVNYLPYHIVDQLITRTRKVVWLDWNPTIEFWFYTEMLGKRDDIDFIGEGGNYPPLTYKDNEALTPEEIQEIESHKQNKQWWRVYGEGKLGELESQIYRGWKIIDEIPHEARLWRRGLDFGYSNDPTSIVDIYEYDGGFILNERLYRKGLSNKQIADFISNLEDPNTLIIADSAEPKSIDEISSYGINILPAAKGKDSIRQGIQFVQDKKISITKNSTNGLKEYRNYVWKTDISGKVMQVPEEMFNHFMDAVRYGFNGERQTQTTPDPIFDTIGTHFQL